MNNPPPPPGTLQEYVYLIPHFLSDYVIPFLLGIAFLFVVINVARYFVIGGANEDAQKTARTYAVYSTAAFVVIFIFWGVIQLLTYSLNLGGVSAPCPDYLRVTPNGPCQIRLIPGGMGL